MECDASLQKNAFAARHNSNKILIIILRRFIFIRFHIVNDDCGKSVCGRRDGSRKEMVTMFV